MSFPGWGGLMKFNDLRNRFRLEMSEVRQGEAVFTQ